MCRPPLQGLDCQAARAPRQASQQGPLTSYLSCLARSLTLCFLNKALNCGEDSKCIADEEKRIILITQAIERRKAECKRGLGKVCRSRLFHQWLRMMRMRRKELHTASRACTDEDQECIRKNMRRILFINRRIQRRRAQCLFKQEEDLALASPLDTSRFSVFSDLLWRQAIDCRTMRVNFRKWVKSMRARRERFHKSACMCNSRDQECIRERFRRILDIQDKIRAGRSDYIELVSKVSAFFLSLSLYQV